MYSPSFPSLRMSWFPIRSLGIFFLHMKPRLTISSCDARRWSALFFQQPRPLMRSCCHLSDNLLTGKMLLIPHCRQGYFWSLVFRSLMIICFVFLRLCFPLCSLLRVSKCGFMPSATFGDISTILLWILCQTHSLILSGTPIIWVLDFIKMPQLPEALFTFFFFPKSLIICPFYSAVACVPLSF